MSLTCWDYIFGLSRTECTCYDPPADYDISNSGLYLDELESLKTLTSLENCENGNDVWDLMEKVREEAVLTFIGDANAMLQTDYKLKRRPFSGTIGRIKNTGILSTTVGYIAGVRWACADIVGGIAHITKIGTLFNGTGVINLTIYNNLGETVDTVALNTVANVHTLNTVDIELPLHDGYIENLEYYFVYTVGALKPLNNTISCNCGKNPFYNVNNPCYYQSQTNKQYGWANYLMVGGYYLPTLVTDSCTTSSVNYLYGLTFDLELKCKVNEVLCEDYMDYEGNPLALYMAHAVRYKAGELLINRIELSPNLNRETMINTEAAAAARDVFITKYNDIVKYIVDRIDISVNDCLECRDLQEMIKAGIFS